MRRGHRENGAHDPERTYNFAAEGVTWRLTRAAANALKQHYGVEAVSQ
jgi:hypothetical protein